MFPVFLFLVGIMSVAAQETAVLKIGPVEVIGIDPLPRNAHKAFYGEYVYGEIRVEAFFTYTDVYRPENWPSSDCSAYSIYSLPAEETAPAFIYQNQGGWTLVTRFSSPGSYCPFLKELIRKLIYFQGVSGKTGDFSFPAILEIPG